MTSQRFGQGERLLGRAGDAVGVGDLDRQRCAHALCAARVRTDDRVLGLRGSQQVSPASLILGGRFRGGLLEGFAEGRVPAIAQCDDVAVRAREAEDAGTRDRHRHRRRHRDERDATNGQAQLRPERSLRCRFLSGDLANPRSQRGPSCGAAGLELVDQVRRRHRVSSSLPAFRVRGAASSRPRWV